ARRDDGGDDGDREQPAGVAVAVPAAVHDGRGAGQRVRGGGRPALPERAHRSRPGALHHHAARQRGLAPADLAHEPSRPGPAAEPRSGRGAGGMNWDTYRRMKSAMVTWLSGLAVLVALIPLGFILFLVVTQGILSLNLAFFTNMPAPVGEP